MQVAQPVLIGRNHLLRLKEQMKRCVLSDKLDGVRAVCLCTNGVAQVRTPRDATILAEQAIPSDVSCTFDGEWVGECLHVFDMLEYGESAKQTMKMPWKDRIDLCKEVVKKCQCSVLHMKIFLSPLACTSDTLAEFLSRCKEGVMFHNPFAPLQCGQDSSTMKCKWVPDVDLVLHDGVLCARSKLSGTVPVGVLARNMSIDVILPSHHELTSHTHGSVLECQLVSSGGRLVLRVNKTRPDKAVANSAHTVKAALEISRDPVTRKDILEVFKRSGDPRPMAAAAA